MVVAIIPARGGSKGVPRKNIAPLGGHPLIAYSVAAARLSTRIRRVIVSTDSEEIAEVSRTYGAEVPFLRPAALASDQSPDRDFVLHAVGWFEKHEGTMPELLVHLRPTTPLRDPNMIDDAISALAGNPEATSLRSGHAAPESPLKWFHRDEGGYFVPLASGAEKPSFSNMPRQAFSAVYVPDGYVDVLRTAFVTRAKDIHGPRILGFVSPPCREVDTAEDLEFLEFQLAKRGSPLQDHLNDRHDREHALSNARSRRRS